MGREALRPRGARGDARRRRPLPRLELHVGDLSRGDVLEARLLHASVVVEASAPSAAAASTSVQVTVHRKHSHCVAACLHSGQALDPLLREALGLVGGCDPVNCGVSR